MTARRNAPDEKPTRDEQAIPNPEVELSEDELDGVAGGYLEITMENNIRKDSGDNVRKDSGEAHLDRNLIDTFPTH